MDAHAHMTYQAPTTDLHNNPTLLLFLRNSTDYLMLAQSWKFGVDCCFTGLTYPAACTQARVSGFWTGPQKPPFTQFAQEECQSTGLEPRIPMIYLNSVEVAQKKSGQKKLKPHQGPPPLPFPDSTHICTN